MTIPVSDGEIVVRHCSVRVVRHGGWSWGPDPDRLARRVLDALPGLLGERFADELAAGVDVDITEPVRLDVSVSLADLLAGLVPPTGDAPEALPHRAASTGPAPARPPGPDGIASAPAALAKPGGPERLTSVESTAVARSGRVADGDLLAPVPDPPAVAAVRVDGNRPHHRTPAVPGMPGPRPAGEVEVHSALPFLLASALARIGLLDPIGAALVTGGEPDDAPLFAAALAFKALGPPGRGWSRSAPDRTAAAAFAGLDGELPEDALTGYAGRAGPVLPRIDALVGTSVCDGHPPGTPLLLAAAPERHGGGLLLVEPEGLFPIAWTDAATPLLPFWEACGQPLVLVATGTGSLAPVGVDHTRTLIRAGVPLASNAAPSRGERWRRLAGAGGPAATDLTGLTDRLGELVAAMTERPAAPLAGSAPFERTMTVTAAVALGTIAWLLWRHREPPDPQLTLARLGDLSGLVRFEPDAVHVRLPLGRRHADLQSNGLLADVRRVAWLGGRTLTFSGG